MNLVERVKAILLQPKSEWPVIEREPGDVGYLFPNYVCIVAAIPPVCSFIGGVIIGYGPLRLGIVAGLLHAIVVYALTLVGVFVVAYVIDYLAGTFNGRRNSRQRDEGVGLCADRCLGCRRLQHHSDAGRCSASSDSTACICCTPALRR